MSVLTKYYCYLEKNELKIVKIKPKNHKKLPENYVANVPNRSVAEHAYKVFLKIRRWRK